MPGKCLSRSKRLNHFNIQPVVCQENEKGCLSQPFSFYNLRFMKGKLILGLLIGLSNTIQSQQAPSFRVDPYFSALIVKNIDSSVNWYRSVLGLKSRFLPGTPQGIKVAILESPQFVLEIIENNTWIDPKELLKGRPEGTRLHGYFKTGFRVTSMDSFIEYLNKLNITIPRIYKDDSGKRNFLIEDPDKNLVQFFE
jgi:hypothetical protein